MFKKSQTVMMGSKSLDKRDKKQSTMSFEFANMALGAEYNENVFGDNSDE